MTAYFMSEAWRRDADDAEKAWNVTAQAHRDGIVFVDAEADTGSRYQVVVTPLPGDAVDYTGGPLLVSVLQPWTAAYCVSTRGNLYESYVWEKFLREGKRAEDCHAGDLKAIELTINYALAMAATS